MLDFFNLLILIIGLVIIYFLLKKDLEKFVLQNKDLDSQKFMDLVNKLTENFSFLKQEIFQTLESTLQKQEKVIESHSKIEEIVRNIESSASEIKTFKEILAGPKSRGYLGEVMLEEILKSLPSSYYEKQYPFGFERVDYVLKINDTLIPIDSKFPTQNYQKIFEIEEKEKQSLKKELIRNLKNKIEDIARKYILPSKGTVEFALMYLANESIYYELLSDKDYYDVWEFAREKSVFITSPKTFEFICSSLLLMIRKQEFSKNIHQILSDLHQLEKDLVEVQQQFLKSYNQLRQSYNNLNELERILNRFILNFQKLLKSESLVEKKLKQEAKSLV